MLKNYLKDHLKKYLKGPLLLAYSGGGDSKALLYLLLEGIVLVAFWSVSHSLLASPAFLPFLD